MNINAENLLRGNLKTKYSQTKQWIEDIEFYEEELSVFNSLISYKIGSTTTGDLEHKEIFRNMDDLFLRLSQDIINQIKAHQKKISQLIDTDDFSENYKQSMVHSQLLEKMSIIKHGIKNLKKALFSYIEDHSFDFDFDTTFEEL